MYMYTILKKLVLILHLLSFLFSMRLECFSSGVMKCSPLYGIFRVLILAHIHTQNAILHSYSIAVKNTVEVNVN